MADSSGKFVLKPLTPRSFLGRREVAPEKIYTVGRSRCCDFVFRDARVSRRQCELFVDAEKSLVLHHGVGEAILVGSSVVYVNGEKLGLGSSRVLLPGDSVSLVVRVKALDDAGFVVENAADGNEEGSSSRELQAKFQRLAKTKADHLGPGLNYRVKRIKVSIERLIDQSRELRSDCFISSLKTKIPAFITKEKISDACHTAVDEVKVVQKRKDEISYERSSGLRMNALEDVEPTEKNVYLSELLSPVEELEELFVASFTADVFWFMSTFEFPKTLPVTVASHDSERSWSTSVNDRVEFPYPEWPKLKVIYPPFPVLRRTNDKSRMRGVGCHHPKLFILKRSGNIRVIITSANLNYRQWLQVSNTVWWQDFPLLSTKDYASLFFSSCNEFQDTTGDFASYLAGFISTLVKDVPSEAHWVTDLACYDFSKASVSLVGSVPGFWGELLPVPKHSKDLGKKYKYLGTVSASVVGISHQFSPKSDPNGVRLRRLAASLSCDPDSEGMVHILLRRVRNVSADVNAVLVSVASTTRQAHFLANDETSAEEVQIGYLPKRTAAWVSTLSDTGLCNFTAMLCARQILAVAAGQSKSVPELALHVFEGPSFLELPRMSLSVEQQFALSALLRSIQRKYGLWRLKEVLSQHKWPDSQEQDFVYCSSSIGTSLNSKFLASFSDAAGRRKATSANDSCESDPEWTRWTAEHEASKPSIKVLFPTLDRVRSAKLGPSSYRGILCFAERTWERMKSANTFDLYDAIPNPESREGIPMHVKVAQRLFKSSTWNEPFGWIYTGSHNFSPAAWGKCVQTLSNEAEHHRYRSCTRLHICNYELGIILVDPPPTYRDDGDSKTCAAATRIRDITLPFVTPPPKYSSRDRPATGSAIFRLLQEVGQERNAIEAGDPQHVLEIDPQELEEPPDISMSDVEMDPEESEEDNLSTL